MYQAVSLIPSTKTKEKKKYIYYILHTHKRKKQEWQNNILPFEKMLPIYTYLPGYPGKLVTGGRGAWENLIWAFCTSCWWWLSGV
jgi:hypothetical protein